MVRHVLIRFKITGRWTTGNLWSFAVSQFQEQLLYLISLLQGIYCQRGAEYSLRSTTVLDSVVLNEANFGLIHLFVVLAR